MKRMAMTAVVVLMLIVLAPSAAWAGEMTTRVVSRVSGVEIASQMISQIRDIEVGARSATVTVDADGQVRRIGVTADDSAAGALLQQETTSGLTKLFAVPLMLGTGIRFLRFLGKLGSM